MGAWVVCFEVLVRLALLVLAAVRSGSTHGYARVRVSGRMRTVWPFVQTGCARVRVEWADGLAGSGEWGKSPTKIISPRRDLEGPGGVFRAGPD